MSVAGFAVAMLGALCGSSGFRVTHKHATRACGSKDEQSASVLDLSIVNGEDAKKCAWPWQVALAEWDNYTSCGGTIISEWFVLTAAHCENIWYVIAGLHNRNNLQDPDVQHRTIVWDKRHPGYDEDSDSYDFMIVEVGQPFTWTSCVGMACLPEEKYTPFANCWITGYGSMTPHHESQQDAVENVNAQILQQAPVQAFSRKTCVNHFDYGRGDLDNSKFCAGTKWKQGEELDNTTWNKTGFVKDACVGDSGGPLVCPGTDGKYTLYGVSSHGWGCGDPFNPGVYANVFHVKDWIEWWIFG